MHIEWFREELPREDEKFTVRLSHEEKYDKISRRLSRLSHKSARFRSFFKSLEPTFSKIDNAGQRYKRTLDVLRNQKIIALFDSYPECWNPESSTYTIRKLRINIFPDITLGIIANYLTGYSINESSSYKAICKDACKRRCADILNAYQDLQVILLELKEHISSFFSETAHYNSRIWMDQDMNAGKTCFTDIIKIIDSFKLPAEPSKLPEDPS